MIVKCLDSICGTIERWKQAYIRLRLRMENRVNKLKKWDGDPNSAIYAKPDFSDGLLNNWGQDTAWNEVKFFISLCHGKVLDIACGTGEVMSQLKMFDRCEIYGCDLVKVLIEKAAQKGIVAGRLQVCSASSLPYPDCYFDYSYSLGSFHCMNSEETITAALKESHRVTKNAFFFQVATSRKGIDEGLIRTQQHFFNNSVSWWMKKCLQIYDKVFVLDSQWGDAISIGKWFFCYKSNTGQRPII